MRAQNDTLIDFQFLDFQEESETRCDSVVDIKIRGNIDCKLIYQQSDFAISDKDFIMVPHAKTDINDHSVLYSAHSQLGKTILELGYDTCQFRDFERNDINRNFQDITLTPDSGALENWEVDIKYQQNGCLDTEYNLVRIAKSNQDFIEFSCARRIQFYELDLNNDALKEVYLISYVWCSSEIRIYRIDS